MVRHRKVNASSVELDIYVLLRDLPPQNLATKDIIVQKKECQVIKATFNLDNIVQKIAQLNKTVLGVLLLLIRCRLLVKTQQPDIMFQIKAKRVKVHAQLVTTAHKEVFSLKYVLQERIVCSMQQILVNVTMLRQVFTDFHLNIMELFKMAITKMVQENILLFQLDLAKFVKLVATVLRVFRHYALVEKCVTKTA